MVEWKYSKAKGNNTSSNNPRLNEEFDEGY